MLFVYKALKENKIVQGKIDAENNDNAIRYLKSNGFFPIEVKTNTSFLGSLTFMGGISFTDVVDLTRQLAIMLNAGLTLIDSFDILKKQITKPQLLKVVEDLDKEVRAGNSFSSALRKYPQHFSNLYIALVRSGEVSGKLSDILLKLSENLEKEREFKGKMKGALIYPVIVIVGMILVMFVMITFVLPRLLGLYKDFNIDLPMTTKILIALSSFFSNYWIFMVAGVVVAVIILKRFLSTKHGKALYDQTILKLPVLGNVVKIGALVDSTRTLSILIQSGVSILEGLNIITETSDNSVYQNAFKSIYKQVEKGVSIGNAMIHENIFPPILVQMTIVGEQTGHLDETLQRISRYFELESELAIKAMTTLIEPLILVVLGFGVGFLVLSVITPIYNLTNSFH